MRARGKVVVIAAVLLTTLGAVLLRDHLRAMGLLLRITQPQTGIARLNAKEVAAAPFSVTSGTAIDGRIYRPQGVENPPGIVLVHGVHRLGPDDPRLVRLAEAFAATGLVVFTPRIVPFTEYRLAPEAIAAIGAAASGLRREVERPVGVIGISFAGGMALIAATDPRFAPDIAFVVALGAHHDLERISIFFATDRILLPAGALQAHESDQYGALVLIYADVERFFDKPDQAGAREAIRLWLGEHWDDARAVSKTLSPSAHASLEKLFRHEREGVRDRLVTEIYCHAEDLEKVSPRGKLAAIRVPVFLIHGVGDKVIPTSETEWLAREVPPQYLRRVLITPLLSHADLKQDLDVREYWNGVQFMRDVLVAAKNAA
jgi:pimeloyl-ACP methyl ester carboxylesterase